MFYLHKELKCLVTEDTYAKYGITDLNGENMYRVTDIPEDLDLRYSRLRVGVVTFHEEDKTVTVDPEITQLTVDDIEMERRGLLQQVMQQMVPELYEAPHVRFRFTSEKLDQEHCICGLMFEPTNWFNSVTNTTTVTWHTINLPVYVFHEDEPSKVRESTMIRITRAELCTIMSEYRDFITEISLSLGDELANLQDASIETIYQIMEQMQVSPTSEFIPTPGETHSYSPSRTGVTKTVIKH